MLKIFTNTVTGKNYDANGDLFEDGMPTIFYKATEKVYWQLCTETPDLVEDQSQTPDDTWTKSTEYAGLGAIGAFLTADSDYIKRLPGKLAVAIVSGAITTISAVVNNAEQTTIPPTGVVSLFDNSGNGETVKYVSRIIGSDGSVIFSLASGSTVEHSYAVEDPMDCSQEPLAQATLDTVNSDVANGLFVFSFTAFSRKLHDLAAYSDTKEIDVRGLELAIFKIDSETNAIVDLQRYEVDTFSVRTGMAETSTNPPLTPPEENATVALVNDLLAAGFTLQYSSDSENWHDTQVTTGETIDVFFRFRSTGSGGTWSSGIRLVKGDPGEKGDKGDTGDKGDSAFLYVRYASDTQGTGFSATPSDSLPYIGVLATTEAIETPSASDFTGLWVSFKGPKGDKGDKGDPGTNGTNGTNGTDGANAYFYVRYASDDQGTDFSATPSSSRKYIAAKTTTTAIANPSASDFSGLWVRYIGNDGTNGTNGTNGTSSYTYVGYAEDSNGTGFSMTPSASRKYVAFKVSATEISDPTASTFSGLWVKFIGDNGSPAEAALEGVMLNGELLTPTDKVVDVNALPIVSALPSVADTEQDIVLYKGEDDATANPPLVKGHTYSREGSWSDSTITVEFGSNTQVLTKVGTSNVWNDTGAPGYETYQISHNGTNWVFDYSGFLFNSPACPATTMPWDDAISGATWTEQGDEGTLTMYVTRAYNGSWVDLTAQDDEDEDGTYPLPYAKTMPTADKDAKDFVLFLGTTGGGYSKGHLYEKTATVDDSSITVEINGLAVFMTGGSGSWTNQEVSPTMNLYYSSNAGAWVLERGFNYTSPQCPSTTMPWDPAVSGKTWNYLEYGSITPIIGDPTTYDWNDLGSILGA